MAHPSLHDLLPRSGGSVYKLVRLASKRAAELADGKPKLIEKSSSEKLTTISLEEILFGKVVLKGFGDEPSKDKKA